jgi:hypothetical protein
LHTLKIGTSHNRHIQNDLFTLCKNIGGCPFSSQIRTELFANCFVFHMDIPKERRYLPLLCQKETVP